MRLRRRVGQRILIGDDVSVLVKRIDPDEAGGEVLLVIEAPRRIGVFREELRRAGA